VRDETVSLADPVRPQDRSFFGAWLGRLRSTSTIVAVFLVSLTFVLALVTLLDYFKFQQSINDLNQRRTGIIIERVHHSLETAIDLGLNLHDIGVARTILGNTQAEDARIENISIFSLEDGRILFASDATSVGKAVDPSWLSAQSAAGNKVWRVTRGDHVLIGERLDSALAAAVGGVVLDYSVGDVALHIAAMRDHLIWSAFLSLVAFSFVAIIGALVVTREFSRTVSGLAEAIASPAPSAAGTIPDSLVPSVDRFKRTTAEAHSQLDRLEDSLAPQPASPSPAEPRVARAVG
jgi:hypothetical protein